MMDNEGWVRPLWPIEASKEMAQAKHQHQLTCYRLGLCSAQPLSTHQIRAALSALYKTCPHLRLRIVEREGVLWFKQMEQEELLMSESSSTNVEEEIDHQITTSFESSTGPLWRSLWLPHAGVDASNSESKNTRASNTQGTTNSSDAEGVTGAGVGASNGSTAEDFTNSAIGKEDDLVKETATSVDDKTTTDSKNSDSCLSGVGGAVESAENKETAHSVEETAHSTAAQKASGHGETETASADKEEFVSSSDVEGRVQSKELSSGENSTVKADVDSHWIPEVADKFPHLSTLLLTFHHAITDGFTSLKTCAHLVFLLDQIAKGCANVDCTQQIGEFSDGSETVRLLQERKDFLHNDPKRKAMVERSIEAIANFRPIFTEAFPITAEQQRNTTSSFVQRFTRDQTRKLLTFFREEKISFNSGFLAMVNLSLVEMLKKRGFKQRVFEISSFTAVNLRRYWRGDTSRSLGCHVGPISLLSDTAATSIHQFLEYAHDVQTNMQDYISHNRAFDERLFLDIKRGTNCSNLDELYSSPPEHPQYWYSLTNMGNVSSLFASEGESVQLGWLSRHLSFHRYNSTFIFASHTFRDRLCFTLGYNARTVTDEVAHELSSVLTKLMLDIVGQMS